MQVRKRFRLRLAAAALLSLGLAVAPASVAAATSAPVSAKPAAQTSGGSTAPVLPAAFAGFFELVDPIFDRCVQVDAPSRNAGLIETTCTNVVTQLWAPTRLGGLTVQWRNPFGFCLEAPANINGFGLIQDVCDINNPGQRWTWRVADPEGHLVLNSDFPNMCLAFDSTGGVIDGRPMILGNCANVDSEMFRIDK